MVIVVFCDIFAKWREIMGNQSVALQPVHVEGHHVRPLLQEALVCQLMGMHRTSQDIIAEAHELVAWGVAAPVVSTYG